MTTPDSGKPQDAELRLDPRGEPAAETPPDLGLDDPKFFLNRELALLSFQWRVLEEAQDESNPLLERAKFLGIVASNLDEFFMVRVAGLKQQVAAGVVDLPPDGLTPAEQLAQVRKEAGRLMKQARVVFHEAVLPQLRATGIHLLEYRELNDKQLASIQKYFEDVVFPVLTPLAFDPGRPFPHISNLSLNLAILIRDPHGQERFARLKVPEALPRLVPIKRSSGATRKDGTVPHAHYFVWLEQVIAANLPSLFPGMEILAAYPFQVTRDADFVIQDLEADDLLETVEEGVRGRRFRSVVRLSVIEDMPKQLRDILVDNLAMDSNDVYAAGSPLGMRSLLAVAAIDRRDLKEPPFLPTVPPPLVEARDGDLFAAIRQQDILLHHPYDSFTPVVEFIETAARDPQVLAIKQTLYRVGRNSPVVEALLEAREYGKQVAVLVELKARFDEESNIGWARALEREGVHVIYGLVGLKTHAKIALVVRNDGDRIRRYVHMSTGNYNPGTALAYTDLGFFTCDEQIGADATDLFNYLTGYSAKTDYRKLLVAPINLRSRLEQLIDREIEHHKAGREGHLIFKVNSLAEKKLIQQLYRASQAGVKVDLLVRGICCLLPGITGISENIAVTSIVGRFLEHSRMLYFRNGGSEEIYLGSADLMPRNLHRRVETLFPVADPVLIRHLRDEVLAVQLADNVKARRMLRTGAYERVQPREGEPLVNSQAWMLARRAGTRRG
jgi:polyphosphate kinase